MSQVIALVDDDRNILTSVSIALQAEGFVTRVYSDGATALKAFGDNPPDLAVFDIKMPQMDGMELLRRVREMGGALGAVPVIFLTSKDDELDEALGLAMGADDYMAKPFALVELSARLRAILRRGAPRENVLRLADLEVDTVSRLVRRGGRKIDLKPKEYALLEYLMRNAGRPVTKSLIIEHVWDYGYAIEPSGVETYISYLRRKLDDRDARLIRTVRGVGYALREPEPVAGDERS